MLRVSQPQTTREATAWRAFLCMYLARQADASPPSPYGFYFFGFLLIIYAIDFLGFGAAYLQTLRCKGFHVFEKRPKHETTFGTFGLLYTKRPKTFGRT